MRGDVVFRLVIRVGRMEKEEAIYILKQAEGKAGRQARSTGPGSRP